MFFKIKVFKNKHLLFATDPDTMRGIRDVAEAFKLLDAKFPESEGYTIDVCMYPLTFPRHSWQRLLKHAEQGDLNSITFMLLCR